MKSQKANRGFGLVGIVIVLAALVVTGAIVWRIYGTSSKQNISTQQTANQDTQKSTDKEPTPASYLDIKELGVKVKLSDDIKDAVYHYDASNTYPLVRVSTQTLIDKSNGACDPKTSSPFGSVRKTQDSTQPDGSVLKPNGSTIFQFGSDYFVLATPNQPCSSDKAVSDLEIAQLASFKEAFKTIQLDE